MRGDPTRRAHRLLLEPASVSGPEPDWVGLRLLEDGDRQELGEWLATLAPGGLEEVFSRQQRRLSRRSRAFWSLVLRRELIVPPSHPLWPEA